jgi:hypothetical protein
MENKATNEVFSLHLMEAVNWQGTAVRFLGTFESHENAIMGFFSWVQNASTLRNGISRASLLNRLRGIAEVEGVNTVLNSFTSVFECDRV